MFKKPIYNAIKEYIDNDPVVFHMPGHKLKGNISEYDSLMKLDVTEIPGTDNLACPEGAIKESEDFAAKVFGADKTFYSVNGSTLGIHAAIRSICGRGDSLIVQRDSHKSVIAGLSLVGAKATYIYPEVDDKFGIAKPITLPQVKEAFDKDRDAKGIVMTSPSYYGLCPDVKGIVEYVHSIDKIVIVDEAHGAHFPFSDLLPDSANKYGADIVVQSAHKTLPAPTQTAMVHVNGNRVDSSKVKYNINLMQTSSPSYMLMTGLDISIAYMAEYGAYKLKEVIGYIEEFNKKITDIGYEILCSDDITRLVIKTSSRGISGYSVEKILREKYNIQVEMSDLNNIVCIATVADEKKDFDKLYEALKEIKGNENIESIPFKFEESEIVELSGNFENVKLMDAIGRVSSDFVIPYPPGIALLVPGEVIKATHIDTIDKILSAGGKVIGVDDKGAIQVEKISF